MRSGLGLFKFTVALLALPITASAFVVNSTSTVNPASVSSDLKVDCPSAVKKLEKDLSKMLAKIPYVRDARVMHFSDWSESLRAEKFLDNKKEIYLSFSPTMAREFPTTFLTGDVIHHACKRRADGTVDDSNCVDYHDYRFNGASAIIYQKTIEAARNLNWMKSFNFSLRLTHVSPQSCRLDTELYIVDNSYLWAKKHLIGDVDPNLIESKILSRFVDWSKSILPDLEAK